MAEWTVEPIGGVLGARVKDIDLREPLSDGERKDLYELLLEHLVLVFPGQSIEDEHQMDLLSSWGRPYIHPIGRTAGAVEAKVERIVDDEGRPPYQDKWHTDVTWDPEAPSWGACGPLRCRPGAATPSSPACTPPTTGCRRPCGSGWRA